MSISSIVLLIATAVSAGAACTPLSSDSSPGAADPTAYSAGALPPHIVELRYDETVDYRDLQLRWLTLEDSRCPIGVTCIWAGQMLATVEIVHSQQGKIEIELLRRAARDPEVSHAFGYELRLLNVDPHPTDGITPDRGDYVLSVEIARP